MPDSAIVPPGNIRTPPAHFTHEVKARAPFWYGRAGEKKADGEIREGARVVVDWHEGGYAWITDERGLHVQVESAALVPLT